MCYRRLAAAFRRSRFGEKRTYKEYTGVDTIMNALKVINKNGILPSSSMIKTGDD